MKKCTDDELISLSYRLSEESLKKISQYDYKEILSVINALITLRKTDDLLVLHDVIVSQPLLTAVEEKYILYKIENATYEFYKLLNSGYIFVWNLPRNLRTYEMYSLTAKHIISLSHGKSQFNAGYKLFRFIQHDNGVSKNMFDCQRKNIITCMRELLKSYIPDIIDPMNE